MSGATAADYAWFDEEYGESFVITGFCLTFVKDVVPEEALRRIGVTPDPAAGLDDISGHPIAAYAAFGGTVLLEPNGFAGTMTEVVRRLSAGTAMASVFLNVNAHQQFLFAADGRLVTGFEPDGPDVRWGADPDRLLPYMSDLGMPTEEEEVDAALDDDEGDDPILTTMALAERATGVRLTRDHLARPALIGSSGHLY
ncbi:DUF6461 domain-containing protein [Sphaerisporangium perillae]|uniref:DUF6461 domain-containing protein n=1 Tax=Sphaerisporangium perillae TaxID=2935860 RepID=UPI00200EDFC5|nr:DUF6461 domain-containing protein [Sphaerisporangium perillae]